MSEKYHFIGIGGIGMSSLARILLTRKAFVSGTDIAQSAVTQSLINAGATVHIGHSAVHITPGMRVVYSTDIKPENPEYLAAKEHQCTLLHRSELLNLLMQDCRSIAVAGTHGKTTTSALLTWVLHEADFSPSYSIGGIVPQLHSHSTHGKGEYFIAEACESDGSFLNYTPFGAIVTNVDLDHMDFYQSEEALIHAFQAFISSVSSPKHIFWCGDDVRLQNMHPSGVCYGFNPSFPLYASRLKQKGWSLFFDVHFNGEIHEDVELALIGEHNALNALAVFGLCLSLGIDSNVIRSAFKTFQGVLRRCEKKGESQRVLFIDDYAHHPTELKTTLKAIRKAIGERRMVVIYQPHRFSRSKMCMGMYEGVFSEADELFITPIYAAREQPIPGITHVAILSEVQKELKQRCHFLERNQAAAVLAPFVRPHDVVVTLGAGDVTHCAEEILSQLTAREPPKYRVGVLFGGVSVEHDVSLMSSEFILSAFNSELYDCETFGISRRGEWMVGSAAAEALKKKSERSQLEKIPREVMEKLMSCDILFPVLHGTCGEDGTLQGFFEILSKPYVGPDYRASALAMDKALTKKLAAACGIPVLPFVSFDCYAWEGEEAQILAEIHHKLRYPLFVKPNHLGSSIGIKKVKDEQGLKLAILEAFKLDTSLIVENGIEAREIEFAVLGNGEVTAFPPGEVFPDAEICTYAGKYHSVGRDPEIIADITPELVAKGIELVRKAYKAVGCTSMSRIDTFLDKEGTFWLNEINPIPGCTTNSPFPKMCMAHGYTKETLIDWLIILALERRRRLDRVML